MNRPPQRYFIAMQFCILATMMLFLLYGSFHLLSQLSLSAQGLVSSPAEFRLQLKECYGALVIGVTSVFLAGFMINVVMGLMFLHRVVGPLVQVKRILDRLANGDFPEGIVRFRRGDFTPELAESLNRLVDCLKQEISGRRHR